MRYEWTPEDHETLTDKEKLEIYDDGMALNPAHLQTKKHGMLVFLESDSEEALHNVVASIINDGTNKTTVQCRSMYNEQKWEWLLLDYTGIREKLNIKYPDWWEVE
jgi:hypothetical protein